MLRLNRGRIRFIIDETGPAAEVAVFFEDKEGEEGLGCVEMRELRHFARAVAGL